MGGASTTSSTRPSFSPETLQALGIELLTSLGQLNPIQREQILEAASLAINQTGTTRTPAGVSEPVKTAAVRATQQIPLDNLGPIIEALQASAQRGVSAKQRAASDTLAGITSFVDPRFANVLQPTQSTSSSTSDPIGTGLSVGGLGAGIAGLAIA
jgi:hypothetical protein